jgi:hypothetical protein
MDFGLTLQQIASLSRGYFDDMTFSEKGVDKFCVHFAALMV